MIIKTISLKIYNPSQSKCQIMDDALQRYSCAFAHLFDGIKDKIESAVNTPITKQTIGKLVDKQLLEELNIYGAQPFKDALLMDVAMTAAGFQTRKSEHDNKTYPVIRLDDERFSQKFNMLCDSYINKKEFSHQFDAMLQKYNAIRPLHFCRHDKNRDYCLLYDSTNDRFYAKMYLLNYKMSLPASTTHSVSRLRYCDPLSSELKYDLRSRRYIIVPLAYGKWQEKYLKQLLENPSLVKTAHLIKKEDDYFLNVKIACPTPDITQPSTYMGICRSLKNYVHFSIVDKSEQKKESGYFSIFPNGYAKKKVDSNLLHKLSNAIVEKAVKNQSQIVLYALGDKYDSVEFDTYLPQLAKGEYNALSLMINYKAELAGLKKPIVVSPVGVFSTCPVCLKNSRKNRMNHELFLCTNCGYSSSIDVLGSTNLALRILSYKQSKIPFSIQKNGETVRFVNKILGFEFETMASESMFNSFYFFLKQYIEENANAVFENKKRSMIKKLNEYDNIKDGIHFLAL